MKKLIFALVALGMAFSVAHADDQTARVPEVLTNSPAPSLDRKTMDQVMARAQAEQKDVILEIGAAWCGPCTAFAYDMDQHPEYLKALTDAGFIFVKDESEKVVEGANLNLTDFLPAMIRFFPTFYLYTPGVGWKFLGIPSSFATLVPLLQNAALPSMTLAQIQSYIETAGASSTDLSNTPAGVQFGASLYNMSALYSYNDAKAIIALLRAEDAKYPNMQLADTAAELQALFMPDYVALGAIPFETLAQDFPSVVADLIDVSSDNFSERMYPDTLAVVFRKSGLVAAQQQCAAIWQTVRPRFVKGTLSDADFQAKLAQFDGKSTLMCASLEFQVTGPTDSLKDTVAKAASTVGTNDWALIAGLGDIKDAVTIYHAQFVQYQNFYNKELAQLNAQLKTATDAGDQAKIAALNQNIAIVTFQLQNHTNVDTDVETALQAGQQVQSLKVFN